MANYVKKPCSKPNFNYKIYQDPHELYKRWHLFLKILVDISKKIN